MTPTQLNELAAQIHGGLVWASWPQYALLVALAIAVIYVNGRFSVFASKSDEFDAITRFHLRNKSPSLCWAEYLRPKSPRSRKSLTRLRRTTDRGQPRCMQVEMARFPSVQDRRDVV